jgi:hypothetical protein
MKTSLYLITFISTLFLFSVINDIQAQPTIEWQKTFGGTGTEWPYAINTTSDNGFIIAGKTLSNNGDVTGFQGLSDYWIVKTDSVGMLQWQKTLGGTATEEAHSIQQTFDGGYIVVGWSNSLDGDVTGNHGVDDVWVVKLSNNGSIEWQKTLGGTNTDWAWSIKQIADSNYVIVGSTFSNDGDVSGNHGDYDVWLVKLSDAGNIIWQQTLGGTSSDQARTVEQTSDGGFIVAASSQSNNGDVSGNHGDYDILVVKLDSQGIIQWQKSLGGSSADIQYGALQTNDEGYFISGVTTSNNGDVSGFHGTSDFWVVKLDNQGNLQWQKCLGGTWADQGRDAKQTIDGGYIVAGYAKSINGDLTNNFGGEDAWLVKLDTAGNIEWQKTFGGSYDEQVNSILQISNEDFAFASYTNSNDYNVTNNHGQADFWIVKLNQVNTANDFLESDANFNVFPNPAKENMTIISNKIYTQPFEISIFNSLGEVLLYKHVTTPTKNTLLNISQLNNGVYFLNIVSNGSSYYHKKIIIMK